MRVFFDNVDFGSRTGPNTFANRLAKKLVSMGHEVVPFEQPHDVHLAFIQFTRTPKVQNTVLRLDGIWFKPEGFEHNNRFLKQSYQFAKSVIVQSKFDYDMIERHFGKRDRRFVIHNGIQIEGVLANKKNQFVCSANWHPQKRLKENVELFQEIRGKNDDAVLKVLGSNADLSGIDSTNVHVLGNLPHGDIMEIYAESRYMIHLAWLDHCPNTVVEALSMNTPVICSSSGGTNEIVKENGIVISEDIEYNFELTDYDSPYPLTLSGFELPEEDILVDPSHLNIDLVAERYLEAFSSGRGN
jgi:glycosyltransferase involved in cell wall biosynthesis